MYPYGQINSCGAAIEHEHASESLVTRNGVAVLFGLISRLWEKQFTFPLMVSFDVIQVSNGTPILGSCERFIIHDIPGTTAR